MAPPWANSGVLLALFLCALTLSGTDGALVKKDHASHGLRRLRNGMEVTGINRDPFNVAGPQGNFEDINLRIVLDGGGGYRVEDLNSRYEVINDGRGWHHLKGQGSANGYKFHVSRDSSGRYSIDNNDGLGQSPVNKNTIDITIIEDNNGGYQLKPEGNFRIVDDGNGWYHTEGEGIYNGQKFHVIRDPYGSFAIEWQKRSSKTVISLGPYKLEFSVDDNGEYHLTPLGNFRIISDGNDWYHPEGAGIPPGYQIHVVRGPDGKFEVKVTQLPSGIFQIGPYKFKFSVDSNGEYHLTPLGSFSIVSDGNDWYHPEGEGIPPGYKIHVARGPDGNFEIKVTQPPRKIFQIGPYKLEFSVDNNGEYHLTPIGNFRIVNDGNDWYHPEGVGIPSGYKIHVVRDPNGNFEVKVTSPGDNNPRQIIPIGPYKLEFIVDGNGEYHLTPLDNFSIVSDGNDWYHPEGLDIPPGYKIHVVRDPNGNFEVKVTQPPSEIFQIGPYKFKFSVDSNGEYHLTPIGNFNIVSDGNDWYHPEGVGIPPGYKIHVARGPDGKFEVKVASPGDPNPHQIIPIGPYKLEFIVDGNGEYHLTPLDNFTIVSDGNDWYHPEGLDIPPGYKIHVVRDPNGNFEVKVTQPPSEIFQIGPYKFKFSVDSNGEYHLTPIGNFNIVSDGNDWYHPEGVGIPSGYKIHVVRDPNGNFEVKVTSPGDNNPRQIIPIGPYKLEFIVDSNGEYHLTPLDNFSIVSDGNDWYHPEGLDIPPGYKIHVVRDPNGNFEVKVTQPPRKIFQIGPYKFEFSVDNNGEYHLTPLDNFRIVNDGNGWYHPEGVDIPPGYKIHVVRDPNGKFEVKVSQETSGIFQIGPYKFKFSVDSNGEYHLTPLGNFRIISKGNDRYYLVGEAIPPGYEIHIEKKGGEYVVQTKVPPPTTTPQTPRKQDIQITIVGSGERPLLLTSPPNKVVYDGNNQYHIEGPTIVQPTIFNLIQNPSGTYTIEWRDDPNNPVVTKPIPVKIQVVRNPEDVMEPKVDGDDATIEKTNYNTYVLHIRGLQDTVFHIENDNQQFVVVQGPPPPINKVPLTVITYPGGTVIPVTSPPNTVVDEGNGKYRIVGPQLVQPVIFYLRQRPDGTYNVEFPGGQNNPVVTKPTIVAVQLQSTPEGVMEPKVDGDDATIEKTNYNTYVLHIRGLPDTVFHIENDNQQFVVVQGPPPPINKVPLTVITYPGGTVIPVTSPPNTVVDEGNGKYRIVGPQLVQPVIFYLRQRPDGTYTVEFPDGQNNPVVTKPTIVAVQLQSTPEGVMEPKVDGDDATIEKTNYNTYVLHIRGLPDTVFHIENDNQQFVVVQGPPPPINKVPLTVITYPGGTVIPVTSPPNTVVDEGNGKYRIVGPQLVQPVIFYLRQRPDGTYTVEFPDGQNNPVVTKPTIVAVQLQSTPEGVMEPKVDGDDATIEKTNYNTYVLHIRGLPDTVFHIENDNQQFVVVQGPPPPINKVPLTVITYPGGTVIPVTSPPNTVVDEGNGKYRIVGPQLVQPVIFYLRQRPDGTYTVEFPGGQNNPVVTKPRIVTVRLEGGVEPNVDGDDATIEKTNYNTYVLHIRGLPDRVFHTEENPKGVYIVVPGYPTPEYETTTFPYYKKITVTIVSDIRGQPLPSVEPPNNIENVGDGTYRLHIPGDPLVRTFEIIKDQSGKFVISWIEDGSTTSPPSVETIKITIGVDDQGRPNPTVESPYYIIRLSGNTFELNGPGVHPGKKFQITRGQNGKFLITWIDGSQPTPNIKITITVDTQGQPTPTVEPPNNIETVGDGTFRLHIPGDPLVRTFELIKDQSGKFVISWIEDGSTTSPPSVETIKITIGVDNQGRPNPTVESPYYIIRLSGNTFELNGPGVHPGKKFQITRGQNGKFLITWIDGSQPTPNIKITITVDTQGQPNPTVEPPNYIENLGDGTFRLHIPGDPLVRTFELIKDQSGKFVISWIEDGSTTSPPSVETIKITIGVDNQGRPNPTVESPYYIIRLSGNTFELNGPGVHPGKKFQITRGQNGKFLITWIDGSQPTPNIKITITVDTQGQPTPTVEPPNYIENLGDGTFRLHVPGLSLVRTFELIKDQSGKFVISWIEDGSTTSPPSMETIKITIRVDDQGRPNPTVESPYYIIRLSENTFELNGPGVHPGKKFQITRGQNGKFLITWMNSRPPPFGFPNIKITITVDELGRPNPSVEPPNYIVRQPDGTYELNGPGMATSRRFKIIKNIKGEFVVNFINGVDNPSEAINILDGESLQILSPDGSGNRINLQIVEDVGGGYRLKISGNRRYRVVGQGQDWFSVIDPNGSRLIKLHVIRNGFGKFTISGIPRHLIVTGSGGMSPNNYGGVFKIKAPDGTFDSIGISISDKGNGRYGITMSGDSRYRIINGGDGWFHLTGPNRSDILKFQVISEPNGGYGLRIVGNPSTYSQGNGSIFDWVPGISTVGPMGKGFNQLLTGVI